MQGTDGVPGLTPGASVFCPLRGLDSSWSTSVNDRHRSRVLQSFGTQVSIFRETSMQSCTDRSRRFHAHCRIVLALAALFATLTCSAAANAQEKKAPVAAPGDTLTTPGPLAQNLSPTLDKRDLAKAMKLVADWQLSRMPADAQVDWTWAALYD